MVYQSLDTARRWFFPRRCLVCDATADDAELCTACRRDLPTLGTACVRCAAPLPPAIDAVPRTCGRCLTRPPRFDTTRALYRYATPIDRLIQAFKYNQRLDVGRVLAEALAVDLVAQQPLADVIVPVPLHRRRLRERGYNQSFELARVIGRRLGLPVLAHAAQRVRPTAAQPGLTRDERRRNVRCAFAVVQPELIATMRVAIVDDVMTSGHTADALAHELKRAGATNVAVWVLARA